MDSIIEFLVHPPGWVLIGVIVIVWLLAPSRAGAAAFATLGIYHLARAIWIAAGLISAPDEAQVHIIIAIICMFSAAWLYKPRQEQTDFNLRIKSDGRK